MCDGKCRLMEIFEEELNSGDIAALCLGKAANRYANEASKQPDPLDEWKKLEPGRKVLDTIDFRVVTVSIKDNTGIGFNDGSYLPYALLGKGYQIIPEGPFDASKLKVGEWAWCLVCKVWVQKTDDPNFFYGADGSYHAEYDDLSFSPPPPPKEDPITTECVITNKIRNEIRSKCGYILNEDCVDAVEKIIREHLDSL